MTARLTFLGAAGTVTGAKFLLDTGQARVLLECGLFQGLKELRLQNWAPASFDSASVTAVLLSHAHIDHSGYLPRLARTGFSGPIYCTRGTADLLRVMLPDAAHLQEEEADYANRHGSSKHRPALPLFSVEDAEQALGLLRPVAPGTPVSVGPRVGGRFLRSGHILGAAIVEVRVGEHRLVYSGDLGRYDVPVMRDPEPVDEADTLLVESTYGNRLHPREDPAGPLVAAVRRAVDRRGWLLIPAFAVGRTQQLLYTLRELEEAGRIPALAVYLDSPMAIEATAIYAQHPEEEDPELARAARQGKRPFVPRRFHLAKSVQDSKALNDFEGPAIVISGSGMATGGRVLHHLRHRLPDSRTTVLFVGYQAAGTRGRLLKDGAKELRIFGENIPVRATVMASDAYSAHADQGEILRWLRGFKRPPRMTYIVHGEPEAGRALRERIAQELGWRATIAEAGATVSVSASGAPEPP
ncbi:MAG: MBL fold metallo-hydrolase [Candidatus Rokubacteria bacterium]|nr:MBL fold metallo-hydrolase [Candidatus Rokubacteria bacterium]